MKVTDDDVKTRGQKEKLDEITSSKFMSSTHTQADRHTDRHTHRHAHVDRQTDMRTYSNKLYPFVPDFHDDITMTSLLFL